MRLDVLFSIIAILHTVFSSVFYLPVPKSYLGKEVNACLSFITISKLLQAKA